MSTTRSSLSSLALLLAVGCGSQQGATPVAEGELIFVRDGLLAPAGAGGRAVGDGSLALIEQPWSAGETVRLADLTGVAPQRADCLPLFSIDLGDVSRLVAMGGTAPDTAVAFSPDGERLAIGSYRGEVLVADAWSGQLIERRKLAETMVKHVVWSPDGDTLYVGEQSPDAWVHALDPATLKPKWQVRLAEFVHSSPAPDGEDLYGVYTLPAAYSLEVLPGGDLLVGAVHGWNPAGGERRNASVLLRLAPTGGAVVARWPAGGAADAVFAQLRTDAPGDRLIAVIDRTAAGAPPADLPVGGVQVLSLSSLQPLTSFVPPPLAPHFASTYIWQGLDIDAARNLGIVGLSDGRVFGFSLSGGEMWQLDLSTPVMTGDVPISASIGFAWLHGSTLIVQTSGTNIPFSSDSPAARPPSPHAKADSLFAWSLADRSLLWTWSGRQAPNGLVLGGDRHTAVVGTRPPDDGELVDVFGALLFDLDGQGSGAERLDVFCATEGPTFFNPAMSPDGRVAVAEHPYRQADGSLAGAYRVTVLR